jgi:hypothetical protein
VLSFEQFRAVIASPPHRAQYGLEVSAATLALLGTDEYTAQTFYRDWTQDGQPRLSALPATAAAIAVASTPPFAPPAAVAVQPASAPPAPVVVAQPSFAPPAAVAGPQSSYAPALQQSSRDPHLAASSAPAPYAPTYATSQAQPSGSGLRNIVVGFGIAIVGTIVTVVSYNASGPGGTFVVAWGAIIFGAIQGIRGIVQQLKD